MADTEVLTDAVKVLFPANTRPQFGQVPPGTKLPWTLVMISIPGASARRLDGRISTRRCVVRVRIAGANDTAVRRVWDNLSPYLERVRPVAEGWRTSPLIQLGDDLQVYPDRDVLVDNQYPIVGAVDFEFMATELPPPEETP